MIPVAIIGAGIAGLACAQRLMQGGIQPVLFDKGRGIGGRVATRRVDGLQFDHGAQYLTARGDGFAGLLRDLAAVGHVAVWDDGSARAKTVGAPGMSALAKGMARGLDVRQNAQVTAVLPTDDGWVLRIGDAHLRAARVVITVPAPQVAGLLGGDHSLVAPLRGVTFDPCLTLMAAIHAPAPFITHSDPDDPLAWIAADGSKPGRPAGFATTWVAQAGDGFSQTHLEKEAAAIAALMLPLLCDRLGVAADAVTHASAHRWRYARVATSLGRPFLRNADATLYLGGDWCIGRRIEAAWDSGTAAAADLLGRASC
jgi:hypothetical protein